MTVDEIVTKFSFKADTNKAEKFKKTTEGIHKAVEKTDQAWTGINRKLAAGFQSTWFDEFSTKVTDFRRIQLFTGGIRRGFEMASKVIPGMKGLSKVVTAVTMKYNKFSGGLVKARSAIRSFGILLGKTVHGIMPMVKSEISSLTTNIKAGVTKAITWMRALDFRKIWGKVKMGFAKGIAFIRPAFQKFTGTIKNGVLKAKAWIQGLDFAKMWVSFKTGLAKGTAVIGTGFKKATVAFKSGFAKLHAYMLASNSKFLNKLGAGITRIQKKIAGMKMLTGLGKKIQGMTANVPGLGKLTAAFGSFGIGAVAALAAVAVAVVGVVVAVKALISKVKKSTEDFLAFEEGMKGVQRVTLASAEDMEKLEEAALKAGEASVFGVKDAADAQKFLAMAGLEVDEVIGALPGTLELAAAAEMDLATAADIATNIMSSNALGVADLAGINDILAYSASNSNQNVQQLGSAIQNIGPAGRLASLSVKDMSSWLSILANNGLRGEEAGTMVRNAIMDLVNPTDKMSQALEAGGVAMGDFVDATGKIADLDALMMALQDMDEVARAAFLGSLDARTYRALAPIITGNVEAMRDFNDELDQAGGTAAKMAGLAFEGLSGALKEYKSKMETANVTFMKDSGLNEFFEEIVRVGSTILPELWKTVGLALKPVVKVLTFIMKVIRVIFTVVGGILKVFNNVARVVMSVLDKGMKPIFDAVDQISVGIKKAFDLLANMEGGPLKGIKVVFDLIGKAIGFVITSLLKMFGPFLFIVDVLLNVFLIWLPRAIDKFFDNIQEKWDNSFLNKGLDWIGDLFSGPEVSVGGAGVPATPSPWLSAPYPGSTTNNNSNSVGDVQTTVIVNGGVTNEDTAAAVSVAVDDAVASQLRSLKVGVQ